MKRRYFEKIPGKKVWKRIEKQEVVIVEEIPELEELF